MKVLFHVLLSVVFCATFSLCVNSDKPKESKQKYVFIKLENRQNTKAKHPVRGPRIIRDSDGFYETSVFEQHKWHYKDSIIRVPIANNKKNPIKLVAYDALKVFSFSIPSTISDTLTLHQDATGFYLVNSSINKANSINWMYQLSEVGILTESFWSLQMPIFLRMSPHLPPTEEMISETYFQELKIIRKTIQQSKEWLMNKNPSDIDSSFENSFKKKTLNHLLYGWRIKQCSGLSSTPESVNLLWQEVLATQDTSLILKAGSLLPGYFSIPKVQSANSSYINQDILLDSILNMNMAEGIKKHYLRNTISFAFKSLSATAFREISEKYIENTHDTIWLQSFFELNSVTKELSNDLLLVDKDGSEITLAELLTELKGKVVYLDFWASWCAPCLSSMPAAARLRELYKDANISFVYLALNDIHQKWQQKSEELGLENEPYNFFIENSKSSSYIDEIDLKTIPRYILFDQEGQEYNLTAPGPDSDDLKKEISSLLNQE